MNTEKVVFTEAASDQIEKFKHEQADKLIKRIIENKQFPGNDFIEITASDVQDEAKKNIYTKMVSKSSIKYIIVYAYFFIGISLMFFGVFYENIISIYRNQPKQLSYIVVGFMITALSGLLTLYINYSEKRKHDSIIRHTKISNLEKMQTDDLIKFYEILLKSTQEDNSKKIA